jgi:hypothetical protein
MNNCLFFDIYSKRIGFFFNNRERIGTYFGLFLTIMYIFISLVFFGVNLFFIIKRVGVRAYDSTLYSKDVPSIDINPDLLYFSFGLEKANTLKKFADESIYYPEILFVEKVKENGEFKTIGRKEIGYEICKEEKFGDDYNHFFKNGELNNSYCLKDYNATLKGGFNYNKISYLLIRIFPCINTTNNSRVCQSQDVIDSYLTDGYFSILAKDIGYDPTNYSSPRIPILLNSYTTFDKSIYREFILYYGITEIKSDIGLFTEKDKTERYLQYRHEDKSFYFRDDKEYYQGKELISFSIRLDELIYVHKRSYIKLPEVIPVIGGYMKMINTIFNLLSLFVGGLIPELEILNSIFHFNLKDKKMTLRIHSIRQLYSQKIRKSLYFPSDNVLFNLNTKDKSNISVNKSSNFLKLDNNNNNKNESNNLSKNSIMGILEPSENSSSNANNINFKKHNSFLNLNAKENGKNDKFDISNRKSSIYRQKNNKKFSNNIINNASISNNYKSMNNIYPKLIDLNRKNYEKIINDYKDQIHFNTLDYYCCQKCTRKYRDIELFKLGLSLYKKRMDIKNVFTLLLYTEKKTLH